MSTEEPATQLNAEHHHLDADAVCAQCHTTNAEGVLICHQCGNNLRDQRHLRLQAEAVLLGQERTPVWRWIVRGAIGIMVLLLPLVALNADAFFSWLANASKADAAERPWLGKDAPFYNGLRQELDAAFPAGTAPPQPLAALNPEPDGFHLLFDPAGKAIGVAAVRVRDGRAHFVTRFDSGVEARGSAEIHEHRYLAQPDDVGVKLGREYIRARGNAGPRPEGGLVCFGQSEASESILSCVAFPLPAPAAQ